jgi:RNA-directed DNA polymerase
VYFKVPKKSGGERQLSSPHRQMATVQRWILDNILRKLPVHDSAHGFIRGRSIVTNADQHVGADIVINSDLCDFFPSITFYRVDGLFRSIGYSPAVATILALLCTECPRQLISLAGERYFAAIGERALPQGACTSPAISNLICRSLDRRFSGIATRLGFRYSRYADDLTFSAAEDKKDFIGYALARIRHITDDEGFAVNHKKTRVQRNHARQSVTGVVVNDKRSINRNTIRQLRAILFNARRTGLASQNRENIPHFESWLRGKIAHVEMVAQDKGRELREQFESLR